MGPPAKLMIAMSQVARSSVAGVEDRADVEVGVNERKGVCTWIAGSD